MCVREREKWQKKRKQNEGIPVCVKDGHRQGETVSFVSVCVLAVIVPSKHIPPQTTKSLLVLSLAFLSLSLCLFSLISLYIFSSFFFHPPTLVTFLFPFSLPLVFTLPTAFHLP